LASWPLDGGVVVVALALMWVGRVSIASSVATHAVGMPTMLVVAFGVDEDAYASSPMSFIGIGCLSRGSSRLERVD
jgi:hypothetical protein